MRTEMTGTGAIHLPRIRKSVLINDGSSITSVVETVEGKMMAFYLQPGKEIVPLGELPQGFREYAFDQVPNLCVGNDILVPTFRNRLKRTTPIAGVDRTADGVRYTTESGSQYNVSFR